MLIRLILIIFFLGSIASCSQNLENERASPTPETQSYRAHLDDEERVSLAKKRRSYITGIRKGDFYSLRNAPEEALLYYKEIQEKLPDDQVVRKKTANVYFMMKQWSKAYQAYIQVPLSELRIEEKDQLLHALFFDETFYDRLGELDKLSLSSNDREYYVLIDTCYTGVTQCADAIQAYTGSLSPIAELRSQIESAAKITDDIQYRNLLIAAKFYEQGMYRATKEILLEVLEDRPDYGEVKKMLGFSLFHLGKYEDAKKYILEYLAANPKDLESMVYLGEVFYALGDFVSSNLYLNNAVIGGYSPKENIERRLAYNYSLLDDQVSMMKVLRYLLESPSATEEDFAVALSVALEEDELDRARSWAALGIDRFPDSSKIIPLYIQILRRIGDLDNAAALLQNTSTMMMSENPNFLLEKAILAYEYGDIDAAKSQFESLLSYEDWPDIVEESRVYLARITSL